VACRAVLDRVVDAVAQEWMTVALRELPMEMTALLADSEIAGSKRDMDDQTNLLQWVERKEAKGGEEGGEEGEEEGEESPLSPSKNTTDTTPGTTTGTTTDTTTDTATNGGTQEEDPVRLMCASLLNAGTTQSLLDVQVLMDYLSNKIHLASTTTNHNNNNTTNNNTTTTTTNNNTVVASEHRDARSVVSAQRVGCLVPLLWSTFTEH